MRETALGKDLSRHYRLNHEGHEVHEDNKHILDRRMSPFVRFVSFVVAPLGDLCDSVVQPKPSDNMNVLP